MQQREANFINRSCTRASMKNLCLSHFCFFFFFSWKIFQSSRIFEILAWTLLFVVVLSLSFILHLLRFKTRWTTWLFTEYCGALYSAECAEQRTRTDFFSNAFHERQCVLNQIICSNECLHLYFNLNIFLAIWVYVCSDIIIHKAWLRQGGSNCATTMMNDLVDSLRCDDTRCVSLLLLCFSRQHWQGKSTRDLKLSVRRNFAVIHKFHLGM